MVGFLVACLACSVIVNIFFAYAVGINKGRANELKSRIDQNNGWEDEAKFWRNVTNPNAEKKRIANEGY